MTDDQQDQQDTQHASLAEALAVAPLDDVTRRRLVRNALDAADDPDAAADLDDESAGRPGSPARRSWAPLAAAAVVVILVIGGIVALSRGGDDSSTDTAARRNTPQVAEEATGTGPSAAAGAADSSSRIQSFAAGARLLGDLGDLSIPATRSSVRAAISGADPPTGEVPESVVARVASSECGAPLRAADVTIVGIGTATVDGADAAVVVTRAAEGSDTASVLVFDPCSLTPL